MKFRDGLWSLLLRFIFEKMGQELMKGGLFYLVQPSLLLHLHKGGENTIYIRTVYDDTKKCPQEIFERKFKQVTKVFLLLMKNL